jgi:hypothetical protein
MERKIMELIVPDRFSDTEIISFISKSFPEFELDESYPPVEIAPGENDIAKVSGDEKVVVVRGRLPAEMLAVIESRPKVLHLWSDAGVEPFSSE